MGMSANQVRLLELVGRQNDLEYAGNFVNNMKTQLAQQSIDLKIDVGKGSDKPGYDKDTDPIDKKEPIFDGKIGDLETERKELTAEIDALKGVIDDNIDKTFGVFSGTGPKDDPKDVAVISKKAFELCSGTLQEAPLQTVASKNATPVAKRAVAAYARHR